MTSVEMIHKTIVIFRITHLGINVNVPKTIVYILFSTLSTNGCKIQTPVLVDTTLCTLSDIFPANFSCRNKNINMTPILTSMKS